MNTPHPLYNDRLTVYTCELTTCALCGAGLVEWGYQSSPKTLFGLAAVRNVAQRPKHCPNSSVCLAYDPPEVGGLATSGAA